MLLSNSNSVVVVLRPEVAIASPMYMYIYICVCVCVCMYDVLCSLGMACECAMLLLNWCENISSLE